MRRQRMRPAVVIGTVLLSVLPEQVKRSGTLRSLPYGMQFSAPDGSMVARVLRNGSPRGGGRQSTSPARRGVCRTVPAQSRTDLVRHLNR